MMKDSAGKRNSGIDAMAIFANIVGEEQLAESMPGGAIPHRYRHKVVLRIRGIHEAGIRSNHDEPGGGGRGPDGVDHLSGDFARANGNWHTGQAAAVDMVQESQCRQPAAPALCPAYGIAQCVLQLGRIKSEFHAGH